MNTQAGAFQRVQKDDIAWLGTDPVPAAPYYDPAWFALEREAVFKRNWLQIGHVCELPEPGSFVRREVEVANASLLIVRGKDHAIRAFHNVCTHRGTQLVAAAAGKQSKFSCPYHMWTYGTDGSLISAPDFAEFHIDKASCDLHEVAVETCAGLIFIHLGEPRQGLRAWLGPLAEKLEALPVAKATTFSEYVYEIEANWKLTYDNFQENYHLRFIHPRSGGAGVGPDNPFGYPLSFGFHGPHRTQTIWVNPDRPAPTPVQAVSTGRAVAALAEDGFLQSPLGKEYFALFPNFFLLGNPVQHFSHMVMPLAHNRSRGVIRLYWIGEDANAGERFAREFSMAVARDIHVEDRAVIEAGQKGLSSGALTYIHFQNQEALCRHLFNSVNDMVQAYKAELHHAGMGV